MFLSIRVLFKKRSPSHFVLFQSPFLVMLFGANVLQDACSLVDESSLSLLSFNHLSFLAELAMDALEESVNGGFIIGSLICIPLSSFSFYCDR